MVLKFSYDFKSYWVYGVMNTYVPVKLDLKYATKVQVQNDLITVIWYYRYHLEYNSEWVEEIFSQPLEHN